ncbi:hypothetical protein [Streptococcus equi]|uniref:hypothetical protein n=1 Tax=Streptococcus equi TaxID=1336 RepID=UPI001E55C19D|nr:hypothetical protein [Streptococcus equi]
MLVQSATILLFNSRESTGSLKAQSITKVEQELSALSNQITELEEQINFRRNTSSKTSIVANEDGVLHLNQEFIGANIVPEGTIFAQVYPEMKKGTVVKITGYLPSTEYQVFLLEIQHDFPRKMIMAKLLI